MDRRGGGGGGGGWIDFLDALVDGMIGIDCACISVVMGLRIGIGGGPVFPHLESSSSSSAVSFFGIKFVSSSSCPLLVMLMTSDGPTKKGLWCGDNGFLVT